MKTIEGDDEQYQTKQKSKQRLNSYLSKSKHKHEEPPFNS